MPINVYCNSSNNFENNIDTSLFLPEPHLRSNYIDSNKEEDFDLKNQFKIENLPDPINIREAAHDKLCVDKKFNDPSIMKNLSHNIFNDKNLKNVRFVKVNSLTAVSQHLNPKQFVDDAIG